MPLSRGIASHVPPLSPTPPFWAGRLLGRGAVKTAIYDAPFTPIPTTAAILLSYGSPAPLRAYSRIVILLRRAEAWVTRLWWRVMVGRSALVLRAPSIRKVVSARLVGSSNG